MMAEKGSGFVATFFEGMPGWSRAIIFAMVTIPMAIALSGMLLQVNVGSHLDSYMRMQLEEQREQTRTAADRIIQVITDRIETIDQRLMDQSAVIKTLDGRTRDSLGRIRNLEGWACQHAEVQKLDRDLPEWC